MQQPRWWRPHASLQLQWAAQRPAVRPLCRSHKLMQLTYGCVRIYGCSQAGTPPPSGTPSGKTDNATPPSPTQHLRTPMSLQASITELTVEHAGQTKSVGSERGGSASAAPQPRWRAKQTGCQQMRLCIKQQPGPQPQTCSTRATHQHGDEIASSQAAIALGARRTGGSHGCRLVPHEHCRQRSHVPTCST